MIISSKDNETVKYVKSLEKKKIRDEKKEYIIEGIKIVKEAIEERADISKVIISKDLKEEKLIEEITSKVEKDKCFFVTKNVMKHLSDTVTPQGILAVVKKTKPQTDCLEDIIFVLDNIQDPGNLGTIIRSLESSGLKQIILSEDTADAYSPKVVRSTMGAIFRTNIINSANIEKTIDELKNKGYNIIATSLDTNKNHFDFEYKKCAIVIGNESKGVRKQIQEKADTKIKIPMLRQNRKFKCIGSS